MSFYIDDNHSFYRDLTEKISVIIYNKEFTNLQSELEVLYIRLGFEKPKLHAFQDALYSYLVQDDGLKPAKAY